MDRSIDKVRYNDHSKWLSNVFNVVFDLKFSFRLFLLLTFFSVCPSNLANCIPHLFLNFEFSLDYGKMLSLLSCRSCCYGKSRILVSLPYLLLAVALHSIDIWRLNKFQKCFENKIKSRINFTTIVRIIISSYIRCQWRANEWEKRLETGREKNSTENSNWNCILHRRNADWMDFCFVLFRECFSIFVSLATKRRFPLNISHHKTLNLISYFVVR